MIKPLRHVIALAALAFTLGVAAFATGGTVSYLRNNQTTAEKVYTQADCTQQYTIADETGIIVTGELGSTLVINEVTCWYLEAVAAETGTSTKQVAAGYHGDRMLNMFEQAVYDALLSGEGYAAWNVGHLIITLKTSMEAVTMTLAW